jgi:hypothetical protein
MEVQHLVDILFAVLGVLAGWVMRKMDESLTGLTSKVQAIELLVAGSYVKRDDLEKMTSTIFQKLDKIESKLDNKADKYSGDHP